MADQNVQFDAGAKLQREREHLSEQLEELSTDESASLDYDENFADSAQVAAEQGENRELATSLRKQLAEVDDALHRLDEGTYGRCARCAQPIPAERLEVMPAAPTCIDCA